MIVSRSLLFVPGNRPDRFDKAAGVGGGGVVLDLEDAVAPGGKGEAREAIAAWGGAAGAVVRINGADTPWFAEDLAFMQHKGLRRLMIPKAEPGVLDAVRAALGADVEIIALIETVAGLFSLRALCARGGSLRLAFGNLDFSLDAGMTETLGELDFVRLQLVLESRFAGLPAPLDGVFPAHTDGAGLAVQVRRAKALGMGGKLCIHPSQVAVVNAGWMPDSDELNWAVRVLSAVESAGSGALSVDGKMVDRPVVERAREIVASANLAP